MIHDRNIGNDAQIQPHKILGAGALLRRNSHAFYVDGDQGSDYNSGRTPSRATATISAAVAAAGMGDTIYVFPKAIPTTSELGGAGCDPANYAETIIIPRAKSHLSIIGVRTGRTQGGLPQVKKGSGTTALLTVRAAGCLIDGIGFNGAGMTGGGGILLDDDGGLTKVAFGTTIQNCHFKNCRGTSATNAATGGAITWATTAEGAAWQVLIQGNRFFKNVGDIVSMATAGLQPQDVVIKDNIFSGPAADVDCNLYLKGAASGMNGVIIDSNIFGQLPALGGTNNRYIDATGCVGMLTRNMFGAQSSDTGTTLTWLANGTAAKIPATMHVAGNWGQTITAKEPGEICISANT